VGSDYLFANVLQHPDFRSTDNKTNLNRRVGPIRERLFSLAVLEIHYCSGHSLTQLQRGQRIPQKQHPEWIRALTPRHINAPAEYWPQKVLAVSSANAAMQNYVSIYEHQTQPNPALVTVHGQAALLLRYDVPTYYVSGDLLARGAGELVYFTTEVKSRRLKKRLKPDRPAT
jgi:hypothetical protein